MNLTVDQVLGLAPDQNLRRATRAIATPDKWNTLAHDQAILWGVFNVSNRAPFQAAIHRTTFAATCTCTSHRRPCNHSLALLLLATGQPTVFAQADSPDWAAVVNAHGLEIGRTQTHHPTKRLRTIRRGLADLERWLHDMIRAGLAQLPNQPKAYWETMAARLVDTRCPKLAQTIRDWATILTSEPNWAEQLLRQLGRMQLLIDAFKRFELVSAETQIDLSLAVGWQPDQRNDAPILPDRWHVIGSHTKLHGRRRIQHTWLWGETHQCYATLIYPAPARHQIRQQFIVGTSFIADLCLLGSTLPLQAIPNTAPTDLQQSTHFVTAPQSIRDLNEQFATCHARNFWLDAYPATLQQTHITREHDRWYLHDSAGYRLPLHPDFAHGWHLMAMASAPLFGVWDGASFRPMSVWHDDQWLELRMLTKVKS